MTRRRYKPARVTIVRNARARMRLACVLAFEALTWEQRRAFIAQADALLDRLIAVRP